MAKFNFLYVCFALLFMFTGCDIFKIDKVVKLPRFSSQPTLCSNENFYIDHINIVNDNSVEIYMMNKSNRASFPADLALMPIENGMLVEVRYDYEIMRVDENNNELRLDKLYPGEMAILKYTMPSNITSCDDYVLFSKDCFSLNKAYVERFAKLSSLVDCSNLNKH